MGTLNVDIADIPAIMARLPVSGPKSGVSYQATSSTAGILTVPDEYMSVASDTTVGLGPFLVSYAANARFMHETSGLTFNGVAVSTTRQSQTMIGNAVALLNTQPSTSQVDFKTSAGSWIQLSQSEMIAIGIAVGSYVQACFSAEQAIDAAISAGTITTTAQIDSFSWPSTTITTSTSSTTSSIATSSTT